MKIHSKLVALVLGASLALSACINLEPPATVALETQAALRIDETSDSLEWITIDRGVQVRASNGVEHLKAVLGGARIYPIEGGIPGSVHLDALKNTSPPDTGDAGFDFWWKIEPDISVVGAGLAEEPDGRLTVWRHSRLTRAAHALESVERMLKTGNPLKLGQFPTFDEASLEQLRAARASGTSEWRIEGRSLVYEIPSTAENALRCEEAFRDVAKSPSVLVYSLGPPQCAHDGRRFTARLVPDESGWIRGRVHSAEIMPAERSVPVAALREAGLPVESGEQLRVRLAQFGLRD
jgi:hypothetical protein